MIEAYHLLVKLMFRVPWVRAVVALVPLATGCDDGTATPHHETADAAPREAGAASTGASGGASGVSGSDAGSLQPGTGGSATDAGEKDAAPPDAGSDARVPTPSDSGLKDAPPPFPADGGAGAPGSTDAGTSAEAGGDAAVPFVQIPNWSVRKRVQRPRGGDLVLEEVLASFTVADPGANRIQSLGASGNVEHSFAAASGDYLSDVCVHPSGQVSAVLIDVAGAVSLLRFDANLALLASSVIHDPLVGKDISGVDGGPTDLFANGFARDAAHLASSGEDVVAVVYSSFYSVIAYRASFTNAWSAPQRTLVEPPRPVTPFLPTGGTFDTFGAMVSWFRPLVDTDEDGNAYVAIWAHPAKVRAHVASFHDGLASLQSGPPHASDSDVLLTRLNHDGTRAWSRVVGTDNEDEPYAIHAGHGQVAVVGRARRFAGFDNTFWDALFSVSTTAGELVGSRAIALDASSILLAVNRLPSDAWVLGGSDGWAQNPDGLSVVTFGTKLLFELPTFDASPLRHALPPGPRHNEVRTVTVRGHGIAYGGHEDGPIMHTGDGDLSQIHATGVLGGVE